LRKIITIFSVTLVFLFCIVLTRPIHFVGEAPYINKANKHRNINSTNNMKQKNVSKKRNGFSLVEMLIVIASIGIMAGIGVAAMGGTSAAAKEAKSKRNAQNICMLYNNASGVSGVFTDNTDKEAIVDDLIAGVDGVDVTSKFKISPLSSEEITAALVYCTLDTVSDRMEYSPGGGESVEQPEDDGEWTDWMGYTTYGSSQQTTDSVTTYNNIFNRYGEQYRVDPVDPLTMQWRYKIN